MSRRWSNVVISRYFSVSRHQSIKSQLLTLNYIELLFTLPTIITDLNMKMLNNINGQTTPTKGASSSEVHASKNTDKVETIKGKDPEPKEMREWNQEETRMLNYLLNYDLTLHTIKIKLPDIEMKDIIEKLNALELPWTRGEYTYLGECIFEKSYIDNRILPLRSTEEINEKIKLITSLSKGLVGVDNWTNNEKAVILFQLQYDLTTGGLFEEFPDKPIDEVLHSISNFEPDWSPVEIFFLRVAKHALYDSQKIFKELPLRSETDIEKMINLVQPVDLKVDQIFIDYLLHIGFTKERLRLEFPGIPTRELVSFTFDVHKLRLPDVEQKVIQKCLNDKKSVNYIHSLIPHRSVKYLENKILLMNQTHRRTIFKNEVDRLIYESQWFASDRFGTRSGSRTQSSRRKRGIELVDESYKEEEKIITFEEFREKVDTQQQARERKKQRSEERKRLKEQRRIEALNRPKVAKVSRVPRGAINARFWKALKEEADYFQSVTGNRKVITGKEKRQRSQTTFFVPTHHERQMMKRIIKKKTAKAEALADESDLEKSEESESTLAEHEEEEEEEEELISPYDPFDMMIDTELPMFERQFFVDEIVSSKPSVPKIDFVEEADFDILTDPRIEKCDTSVTSIIIENQKRYKDLPSSFPKIFIINALGDEELNSYNKIRIRTLLYPDHYEMFILGLPKSEELNPIVEIQKLFQIHCCLYFSHSTKLKDIIYNDYCLKLDKSIVDDDFVTFMEVIDNWNKLMLILSPTDVNKEMFEEDINPEVRGYLSPIPETFVDSANVDLSLKADTSKEDAEKLAQDLKLDDFYQEIVLFTPPENSPFPDTPTSVNLNFSLLSETPEPEADIDGKEPSLTPKEMPALNVGDNSMFPVKEPTELQDFEKESIGLFQRPKVYKEKFFECLKSKNTISRFCMQQFLVRVYSRVVSTRSSKLRKYKAFTAEVYGELLPSFMSEVLTKIMFKPGQRFYDLGSGVGNTTFQAALEFGAGFSGGCELMEHASYLTEIQANILQKQLRSFGIKELNLEFVLNQSFVDNKQVRDQILDCDVIVVNNYLFDMKLNVEIGKLLYGLKPGAKLISLKNFITPRYKSTGEPTLFDYLSVERHEMSDFLSVSWTANKVPYYISTVEEEIQPQYL